MIAPSALLAAVFLFAVVVFAVGVTWASLRSDAHTPKALQSDGEETDGSEQTD